MKYRTRIAALAAATALVVVPAASVAQTPTNVQYGTPVEAIGVVAGAETPPTAPPGQPTAATVGALPFTGMELRIMTIAGAMLLGAGLILRRVGFASVARRSR
jgi:hypothetical protein